MSRLELAISSTGGGTVDGANASKPSSAADVEALERSGTRISLTGFEWSQQVAVQEAVQRANGVGPYGGEAFAGSGSGSGSHALYNKTCRACGVLQLATPLVFCLHLSGSLANDGTTGGGAGVAAAGGKVGSLPPAGAGSPTEGLSVACTPPTPNALMLELGLIAAQAAAVPADTSWGAMTLELTIVVGVVVLALAVLGVLIGWQSRKAAKLRASYHAEPPAEIMPTIASNFKAFKSVDHLKEHKRSSAEQLKLASSGAARRRGSFDDPHFYPTGDLPSVSPAPAGYAGTNGAGRGAGAIAASSPLQWRIEDKAEAVFEEFDKDKSGTLDLEEMASLIKNLDVQSGSTVLHASLSSFDTLAVVEMMELQEAQPGMGIDKETFVNTALDNPDGFLSALITQCSIALLKADHAGDEVFARRLSVSEHNLVSQAEANMNVRDKAMACFMIFDVDDNGNLDRPEVRQMITSMIESVAYSANDGGASDAWKQHDAKEVFNVIFPNYLPDVSRDAFGSLFLEPGPLYDLVEAIKLDGLGAGASKAKAAAVYRMFDSDRNGNLSLGELQGMVGAMANADPNSLIAKELARIDPTLVAEMIRLEFDDDGDGVVTEEEFLTKCCDEQGVMAALVVFTDFVTAQERRASSVDVATPHQPEERRLADAKLAALLRNQAAKARESTTYKDRRLEDAARELDRRTRQSNVVASFREQDRLKEERARASSLLASANAKHASKALETSSTSIELFGQRGQGKSSGEFSQDKKSKIWMALNPQPLARQTLTDRQAGEASRVSLNVNIPGAEELDLDFPAGPGNGIGESYLSTGEEEKKVGRTADGKNEGAGADHDNGNDSDSDNDGDDDESSDDTSSEEEDFDEADLELDAATAARLAENRASRASSEASRAVELALAHTKESAAKASILAEELAVIDAREKLNRKSSLKVEAQVVAEARERMASELKFDFSFFANADTDGDGMLSLEEALAQGMSESIFKMIDADGNGFLTKKEMEQWMAVGRTQKQIQAEASRRVSSMSMDEALSRGVSKAEFEQLDSDLVGRIKKSDFLAQKRMSVLLAKQDSSNNLGVSFSELQLLHAVLQGLHPNGTVTAEELGDVIEARHSFAVDDLKSYVATVQAGFDADGKGDIDYEEYVVYIASTMGSISLDRGVSEQLRYAFEMYDHQAEGVLDEGGVRRLLEIMSTFDGTKQRAASAPLPDDAPERGDTALANADTTLTCELKSGVLHLPLTSSKHVSAADFIKVCSANAEINELCRFADLNQFEQLEQQLSRARASGGSSSSSISSSSSSSNVSGEGDVLRARSTMDAIPED